MVQIKPMGEDYMLPRCLHAGPIDAAAGRASEPAEPDLPPHPWSDERIRDLVAEGSDFDLCDVCDAGEGFPREFMREMIRRYGTCALLAWEGQTVVGFIRFYPMMIARMLAEVSTSQVEPVLDCTLACAPEEDQRTLWVQCVMTCRPYAGSREAIMPTRDGPTRFPGAQEAGARKGIGLKLARAVVPWAKEHGWKRIVKVAHPDLDFFYGIWGGGGRAFWEKAGFTSIGTMHRPQRMPEEYVMVLRSQMAEKGMTEEEVWTFHRMAYEL